jgi:transcription elongation factor B subunit 1
MIPQKVHARIPSLNDLGSSAPIVAKSTVPISWQECLMESTNEQLGLEQYNSETLSRTQQVVLISGDGRVFMVHQQMAQCSGVLARIMRLESLYSHIDEQRFEEVSTRIFRFDHIPGNLLEKVCQYMQYKLTFQHCMEEYPEFDQINAENAADLFLVADYLDL